MKSPVKDFGVDVVNAATRQHLYLPVLGAGPPAFLDDFQRNCAAFCASGFLRTLANMDAGGREKAAGWLPSPFPSVAAIAAYERRRIR